MLARQIEAVVEADLRKKMVFLSGPRQCGKTTLAKRLLDRTQGRYYTWDSPADRRDLRSGRLDAASRLWVLDEIHKSRQWRNWLKGLFDTEHPRHSILVTGSARLGLYDRGGDSLQGRYFMHHLHPFTLRELAGSPVGKTEDWLGNLSAPSPDAQARLRDLLQLGGFPEPFLGGSEREASRWRLDYGARLVREDVRDLEDVADLDKLELLFERLERTVGSPLSINALRQDLEVAYGTARSWIAIFERLCAVFRVPPFGPPRIQAVKKESKLYFWDWARVPDPAARFENLVAVHLLRFVHWLRDVEGRRAELRYFRTRAGHEVDFIVLLDSKPAWAVEVKLGERDLDAGLRYLIQRVPVPQAFQISLEGTRDYVQSVGPKARARILPAASFLSALP